jgi:hypothetical protein
MENDWISVKDKLPLEDVGNGVVGVFDEYLVTVQLKDADEYDDPEVTLLYFSTTNGYFSKIVTGNPFEYNSSWYVTHWMDKPKPAGREDD